MNPLRILVIVGTRPEAIKMAPIVKVLQRSQQAELFVCSTGQHREMLDQVFELFDIEPDVDLDVMRPNQTPTQVAARVLMALEPVLDDLRPDWMLVQGDTTTVMAAAIAAHYRRVRVGHVEAGLRTYDRDNPFPEEMNRVIADHVSDLHFAPTASARTNLLREGISEEKIFVTGNSVIDALLQIAGTAVARRKRCLAKNASTRLDFATRTPKKPPTYPRDRPSPRKSWAAPTANLRRLATAGANPI